MRSILMWLFAATTLAAPVLGGGARRPPSHPRCFGASSRDALVPCDNPSLRLTVTPSPDAALLELSEPCRPLRAVRGVCRFGVAPGSARGAFALVGDSHAVHWRAALKTVAGAYRWTGYSATRSTCLFTLATPRGRRCRGFVRALLRWLRRRPDIRTVFISGNATSHVLPVPGQALAETQFRGFERAFRALPARIRHVFVIHDVPQSSVATQDCVRRAMGGRQDAGTVCARRRSVALAVDSASVAAKRLGGRVFRINLTDFMCDATWCHPVVGGALVIKDIGHLTRTFARTLGPYLLRAVRESGVG